MRLKKWHYIVVCYKQIAATRLKRSPVRDDLFVEKSHSPIDELLRSGLFSAENPVCQQADEAAMKEYILSSFRAQWIREVRVPPVSPEVIHIRLFQSHIPFSFKLMPIKTLKERKYCFNPSPKTFYHLPHWWYPFKPRSGAI
jgi:hypothetical protein